MSARGMAPPSPSVVGLVVAVSIVATAFHFTDNLVSIETYPQPGWISEGVVAVSWFLYSAAGIGGYLLYRRGELLVAHALLFLYAFAGLGSLGHFLSGSPDEFTTRGLISVFVDGAAGAAVLATVAWSVIARAVAEPNRKEAT
jgi:hypothetical protein